MKRAHFFMMAWAIALVSTGLAWSSETKKKLILIAGKASHGPMTHEFRAGTMVLEKRLAKVPGLIVERHDGGWVTDEKTFDDATGVVIFADGGVSHPLLAAEHRLALMEKLMNRGVGLGCMHYAVDVPKDRGASELKRWIGGCYEELFSCNPVWKADFLALPDHPICQGVKPFSSEDEWYFNMRFAEGFDAEGPKEIAGLKFRPILVASPSDQVREGRYGNPVGPYDHIIAAKGRKEGLMWAVERPDGGRGFGFTGGHFHRSWQNESQLKVVLNALCWVAKFDVPAEGIIAEPVSDEELKQNLDPKQTK
jgi:hypothetical protein